MTEHPPLTVQQVMRVHVPTLHPGSVLRDALDKIHLYQVTALPVVDDDRRVVGIVSRSEVLLHALEGAPASLAEGAASRAEDPVAGWMSPVTVCAEPGEPASAAGLRMLGAATETVPVVSEGRMVGTLCLLDILQAMLAEPSLRP
ncbi:MAG: CBS domain-containing protein [Fimbriimonadia bacterium]|jgi:CBS domain-containing membrane protein